MAKRFLYHANAVGFSGMLKRPVQDVIEAQASSALSSSGGFGRSRVEKFNHKGIVRFDSAETMVSGSAGDKGFDTLVSATIENLNILNIVTADRVIAHMTSRHIEGVVQPVILPLGSRFEGLKIGGHPISVDLNGEPFCKEQDYDCLCRDLSLKATGELHARPLVSKLPDIPGCKVDKNEIKIPHFGSVFLADYLISPQARRLIMIRVELGCPCEGSMALAEVDGNGSEYPPN